MKKYPVALTLISLLLSSCSVSNTVPLSEYTKIVEEKESLRAELNNSVPKREYESIVKERDELLQLLESPQEQTSDSSPESTASAADHQEHTAASSALSETGKQESEAQNEQQPQETGNNGVWTDEEYIVSPGIVNANVRLADDQSKIWTQLNEGTVIGRVKLIEGSDFAEFSLDGRTVVIQKKYITPVK